MKNVVFCLFFICLYSVKIYSQEVKNYDSSHFRINSGKVSCNTPLYFINGDTCMENFGNINPKYVGAIFIEMRQEGTLNNADTPIIAKYLGKQQYEHGVIFLYTKDKVRRLSKRQFKDNIKNGNVLLKIDNNTITNDTSAYHKVYNKKIHIKMIKEFKLTKWNMNITDAYCLFLIETKE